jgi:hypothetical protein
VRLSCSYEGAQRLQLQPGQTTTNPLRYSDRSNLTQRGKRRTKNLAAQLFALSRTISHSGRSFPARRRCLQNHHTHNEIKRHSRRRRLQLYSYPTARHPATPLRIMTTRLLTRTRACDAATQRYPPSRPPRARRIQGQQVGAYNRKHWGARTIENNVVQA